MPTKVIIDVFLIKDGSKMSRWFIITFLAEAMRSVFPTWWSNDSFLAFKCYSNNAVQEYKMYWATFQMSPNYCQKQARLATLKKIFSFFNFVSKKCGFVFQQRNFQRKYIATRNYEKFRLHNWNPSIWQVCFNEFYDGFPPFFKGSTGSQLSQRSKK